MMTHTPFRRLLPIEDDSNFQDTLVACRFEAAAVIEITTAGSLRSLIARTRPATDFDYAVVDLILGRR